MELSMPFLAFYKANLEASAQLQRSSESALKLTSEQCVLLGHSHLLPLIGTIILMAQAWKWICAKDYDLIH